MVYSSVWQQIKYVKTKTANVKANVLNIWPPLKVKKTKRLFLRVLLSFFSKNVSCVHWFEIEGFIHYVFCAIKYSKG